MRYSSNLAELLSQRADNLDVKYRPDTKLAKREDGLYYRVYTDTRNPTPPEITQPLSKPLYTREMKTAIMKRWLEIKSNPTTTTTTEPEFDIGVYLTPAEQYSTFFHLFQLGDENAKSDENSDIKSKLIKIISENKDFSSFINEFYDYSILSFKYLSDKLTGKFTIPREGELIGLNEDLLERARNTIVYEEKRKLVKNNLDAFREFTHDPRHFEYVKDLDYFFLVFESFIPEGPEAEEAARLAAEEAGRVAAEAEAAELAARVAAEAAAEAGVAEAGVAEEGVAAAGVAAEGVKHKIKKGEKFGNIKMIETQVGAGCGIHAIKNLLQRQINTADLAAVVESLRKSSRENLEILLDKKIKEQSSQEIIDRIIKSINETNTCPTQMLSITEISLLLDLIEPEESGFNKYGHQNINVNLFNTIINLKREKGENFIGFIQNLSAKQHFVAWIQKGGHWYEINSRVEGEPNNPEIGTITKYTFEDFERKFSSNDDELLAVFKIPAPTTGAGRITKNKSKRRYTSKKRTGKKSKKISY